MDKSDQSVDDQALKVWWKQIDQWREKMSRGCSGRRGIIKPQQAIQALYELTEGDAFISSDVGQHQMFAAQHYGFDKPGAG